LFKQSFCGFSGQIASYNPQYASQLSPQLFMMPGLPPPGAAAGQNIASRSTLAASFA
jgi:hypothetical protein